MHMLYYKPTPQPTVELAPVVKKPITTPKGGYTGKLNLNINPDGTISNDKCLYDIDKYNNPGE